MRSWVFRLKENKKQATLQARYYDEMQKISHDLEIIFGHCIMRDGKRYRYYVFEIDWRCPLTLKREFFARGFKRYQWVKGELIEK